MVCLRVCHIVAALAFARSVASRRQANFTQIRVDQDGGAVLRNLLAISILGPDLETTPSANHHAGTKLREGDSREVDQDGVAGLLRELVGPILGQPLPRLFSGEALLRGLHTAPWLPSGHSKKHDHGSWYARTKFRDSRLGRALHGGVPMRGGGVGFAGHV